MYFNRNFPTSFQSVLWFYTFTKEVWEFGVVYLFTFNYFSGILLWFLICIFLMTDNVKELLFGPFSYVKCLFKYFGHFKNWESFVVLFLKYFISHICSSHYPSISLLYFWCSKLQTSVHLFPKYYSMHIINSSSVFLGFFFRPNIHTSVHVGVIYVLNTSSLPPIYIYIVNIFF